jgi:hypothetical protein
MEVHVSSKTEEGINREYPHLTTEDIQMLFIHGDFKRNPIDYYENVHKSLYPIASNVNLELHIPIKLAEEFKVDTVINLIPDENGIVYTVTI